MSKEHAMNFLNRLDTDQDLKDKVRAVTKGIVDVAKAHGYNFSHDEFNQALAEKWDIPGSDVSFGGGGSSDPSTCISERPGF